MPKIVANNSMKKHRKLSMTDKIEILKKLSSGISMTTLSEKYGINKSTVCRVKKNEDKLKKFLAQTESGPGRRKTLRPPELPKMEKALFDWFMRKRVTNVPVTMEILREKAKVFHRKFKERPGFNASDGWLNNFKKRHGIRILKITGEKLSNASESVNPFITKFQKTVTENNLRPEQIYNADESGLFWKLLPDKTLVHSKETSAPGRKSNKQRITFLACTNSTGSHKLTPLVIGKAQKPRVFRNMNTMPCIYKANKNAWMNLSLFEEWIEKYFIPEVVFYLNSEKLPKKVLLLLDNAPCHPKERQTEIEGLVVILMLLPPNCTAILQPMDQNVINMTKLYYKKSLLTHLVVSSDYEKSLKELNLKHAICFLINAWNKVSASCIKNCWKKLMLPSDEDWDDEDDLPISEIRAKILDQKEIQNMFQGVCSSSQISQIDLSQWLEESHVQVEVKDVSDEENNEEDSEVEIEQITPKIKLEDAIRSFSVCLEWAEQNDVALHELVVLQQLREKAVTMRNQFTCQAKILDYFAKL